MTEPNKQLHVLLLAGGASPEREVSKLSSKSIYEALLANNYKVTLHDPAYGKCQPRNADDYFDKTDMFAPKAENYVESFSVLPPEIDVVFIGLHGKWGEDGTIQSILELLHLPYTGSGVLASSLAMDKQISKIILKDHGVTIPEGFLLHKKNYKAEKTRERVMQFPGLPCVVKPNDQGSTVGLTVCYNEDDLLPAFEECYRYSDQMLVEEFIPGREITAGILGETALPVLEIRPKHNLYDYECKYTHGMSEYLVPAPLPDDITAEVQRQTLLAFRSLGCSGYGRADFRITDDNRVYCLEMNTLPGMTSTSLVPKMAKHLGISFPDLVKQIIEAAL